MIYKSTAVILIDLSQFCYFAHNFSSDFLTHDTCLSCENKDCPLEDTEELRLDGEVVAEEIVMTKPGDIMIGGMVFDW